MKRADDPREIAKLPEDFRLLSEGDRITMSGTFTTRLQIETAMYALDLITRHLPSPRVGIPEDIGLHSPPLPTDQDFLAQAGILL
jgi:hypothetical protein